MGHGSGSSRIVRTGKTRTGRSGSASGTASGSVTRCVTMPQRSLIVQPLRRYECLGVGDPIDGPVHSLESLCFGGGALPLLRASMRARTGNPCSRAILACCSSCLRMALASHPPFAASHELGTVGFSDIAAFDEQVKNRDISAIVIHLELAALEPTE